MPYTILITLSLNSIVHSAFLAWLWYKLLFTKHPLMIEYPIAQPTAPIYETECVRK